MKCPNCGVTNQSVLEVRGTEDGFVNRRRRSCHNCGYRFTTFERIEPRKTHKKISLEQKKVIEKRRDYFVSEDLAELFGCHISTIRSIKRGDYCA